MITIVGLHVRPIIRDWPNLMRVLLTAFEPYDAWERNSSWDTLVAFLVERGASPHIVTRRYPVDLAKLQNRLELDLSQGVDAVLHLGQAPGISHVQLESIGINVAGIGKSSHGEYGSILDDAPVAYRTRFPVGSWVNELQASGIPAKVSYHAGTYLCNAAMFLSHHWFARRQEKPMVGFVHLPLTPAQAVGENHGMPSMSTPLAARALELIVDRMMGLLTDSPGQLA